MSSDALKARVLAAAAATPSATRPAGQQRGFILLLASLSVAQAIFEGTGGLYHAAGRPLATTLAIAGGWALFAALLSAIVLWRRRSTLGRPPLVLLLAALLTPIALTAWMALFAGTYAEPRAGAAWECASHTLATAALPLGAFVALRRGTAPRAPWALGAATGAVCGAWAAALVAVWCPLASMVHVLAGHALPVAILVGAGAILGRSLLGVRAIAA